MPHKHEVNSSTLQEIHVYLTYNTSIQCHIHTQAALAHRPLISCARMPHQQHMPPHISSLSTPCSTTPCRNSCMPHQHHMHCPLAPHAHIQLDTPNNQLVFTFCVQQAFLLLLRNSSLPQISSFLL